MRLNHPEACVGRALVCCLRHAGMNEDDFLAGPELLDVQPAVLLTGSVRRLDDDDEPSEASIDDETDISTVVPSDDIESEPDEMLLMSTAPISFQMDVEDPYPWEVEGWLEIEDQELQHEDVQAPIAFGMQHLEFLQDEIEQIARVSEDDDRPWLAVTFGLGLIDLGRRDIEFNPDHLDLLLEDILHVWRDHAAYGNLLVFNVHPQPLDVIGPRAIALLVVVDMPESMDDSIRHVLVVEQAAPDVHVRSQPYAARLVSATTDRVILAHLNLHQHCPPHALRPCHVRLGEMHMEPNVWYEYEHGTLCRTWIGRVHSQVVEAENTIQRVEPFFLQVQTLLDHRGSRQSITCRVHGISPANFPLGHREIIIDSDWIYDLEWIDQMRSLWPFDMETAGFFCVQSATSDMLDEENVVFSLHCTFWVPPGCSNPCQSADCGGRRHGEGNSKCQ